MAKTINTDKILTKAIKKAGNQSKLAKVSGVSRACVNQWSLGLRPIPDRFILFLSAYLLTKE